MSHAVDCSLCGSRSTNPGVDRKKMWCRSLTGTREWAARYRVAVTDRNSVKGSGEWVRGCFERSQVTWAGETGASPLSVSGGGPGHPSPTVTVIRVTLWRHESGCPPAPTTTRRVNHPSTSGTTRKEATPPTAYGGPAQRKPSTAHAGRHGHPQHDLARQDGIRKPSTTGVGRRPGPTSRFLRSWPSQSVRTCALDPGRVEHHADLATDGLGGQVRLELRPHGARVAVAPGHLRTGSGREWRKVSVGELTRVWRRGTGPRWTAGRGHSRTATY